MIVCGVPFEATTTQDLKLLRDEIDKEVKKRENAAKNGEWNTVRQAVKNWIEKYGPIYVDDVNQAECGTIDSRSFGALPGEIFLF